MAIKQAEEELDSLKSEITPLLHENEEIPLEYGTLVLMPGKPVWKYSDAVTELQAREKAEGIATQKYGTPYLQYNRRKTGDMSVE